MPNNITGTLAKFSAELNFADLPDNVIHEAKRGFLDTIGCAIGALEVDKGSIAVKFAKHMGGRKESTILGTGYRVSAPNAAFANGELMHALDYTALLPPGHSAPYVTPSPLALAEIRKSSGKNLITAIVLSHEIATRIGVSLGGFRLKNGKLARVFGMSYNVFGAAAGAGKIMGLNSDKMADALGLAGYFAPIPSHQKFLFTTHNGMQKYGPSGWIAQGGLTAAILAEMGERGDREVLDGDYGFWAMSGAEECNWDVITRNLGKDWNMLQAKYKCWPCCGAMQSPLGAISKLVEDYDLKPEEIQQIVINSDDISSSPQFLKTEVDDHCEAQNSLYYVMAAAFHRIKVGPEWQSRSNIDNPSIKALMKKIKHVPYPKAMEVKIQELKVEGKNYLNRRPSLVEVSARGKVFTQSVDYAKWISAETPEFRATDKNLADKFTANVEKVLEPEKLKTSIDMIMNLEKVKTTNELIKALNP